MGARRTARERALQALYQLDVAKGSAQDALASAWASEPEEGAPEADAIGFAEELVKGVQEHLAEIDALIEAHSHNWRVDRMARIDRNVLRLAIYELKYRPDIPRNVTLNEAIELGKIFGAEGSSAFINGLLDRIAAVLERT
jgi:transcription antitermination protein NusB